MIRRHVLAALAIGVETGSVDAARGALESIEWALRGRARRRLEAAFLDAALAVGTAGEDAAEATRHWLRAAALIVRDQPGELADCQLHDGRSRSFAARDANVDRARVAATYGAAVVIAPTKFPLVTLIATMCVCGVATAFGAATVRAIQDTPSADAYQRPTPPPPNGVYRDGGPPRRALAIEAVLTGDFPKLVAMSALVGTHRGDEPQRTALVAKLRATSVFAAHGPQLATAWRTMLDTFARWMVMQPGDRGFTKVSTELRARCDVFSDQLAAAELGYYVDPEIVSEPHPRRRAGIFAYRVEDVAFVKSTTRGKVRVLGVHRLDAADRGNVLGITQDELADPVVLLDGVDAKVATQILPVLAGRAFPLADDPWTFTTRGREATAAAAYAIRRELLAALYMEVDSPERAAARTRALIYTSVRHHEAQHKIDREGGSLAYPAELSTRLGDKKNDPFAIRSRYELSAYLSQLASDTWLPQLTLWNLARHGFHDGSRREETYVAVVVIEGLARKFGIPPSGPIVRDGKVDRDRLAQLAVPLAQRTTVELRTAATQLWGEMFGSPLVRLYD